MQQLREQLAGIPGAQYEFARPSLLTLATPVEVILAGYDLERLVGRGERRARCAWRARGAFKRHSLQHRRRPSRDPDPLRPGTRLAARPRGARHRRSRGVERARRRGHALPPAGKEDRRAGAQRRYARGLDRGSPQPRGESRLGTSGAAVRGRRSAPRDRAGGNPPRQPGTRRGDLRGAGAPATWATRRAKRRRSSPKRPCRWASWARCPARARR